MTFVRGVVLALPFIVGPAAVVYGLRTNSLLSLSDCPLLETLAAEKRGRELLAQRSAVSKKLRRIEVAGDMQHWLTPHGEFWVPSASVDRLGFVISEQVSDIYGAVSLVRVGDTVIDCGADIGTFVRTALNRGAAKVIAVEPAPWKEPCLRRTFAREIESGKVVVYPKGVWNEDSKLKLDGDTLSDKGVEVPLTTIDHIVQELSLDRVDVIKMDIEGAERRALNGARLTIQRFKPRLTIATEHLADDYVAVPRLIQNVDPGYTVECGICVGQFGRLQPYTMYFLPKPGGS